MKKTTIAKLRKNAKDYFDHVEGGEVIRVYRRGQPIADIVPVPKKKPSWKREIPRLSITGVSLTREILKDRAESDQ